MARKQHSHHFIYKTTCIVTNRFYIGMHSTSDMNDGYLGSGKRLWNSIKKHGHVNHRIEILEFYSDRGSLKKREKELVNEDLLKDPMCMNLVIGGEGGIFISKEQQILNGKKSAAIVWANPEYRKNHSLRLSNRMINLALQKGGSPVKNYNTTFLNKTHTTKTKNKIGFTNSQKQKGSNNSQFGTCWITNGIENKKIKTEILNDFIIIGWKKGRTNNTRV